MVCLLPAFHTVFETLKAEKLRLPAPDPSSALPVCIQKLLATLLSRVLSLVTPQTALEWDTG